MRIAPALLAGLTAGAIVLAPTASHAQSRTSRSGAVAPSSTLFDITPYMGYMVFGSYLSGPLGSSVTSAPASIYGAQLGMHIAPNISMIGNLAAASSDIQVGLPYLGGISVAHNEVVMYDAGLQLDIPVTSAYGVAFSPFLQGGVGAIRNNISESLLSTTATNLAGNVGLGADIAIGNGVGLRLMAKDYIGKFNFQQATSFDIDGGTTQSFAFTAGARFSF
jgi:Outer membrane protein beta-barrel domain